MEIRFWKNNKFVSVKLGKIPILKILSVAHDRAGWNHDSEFLFRGSGNCFSFPPKFKDGPASMELAMSQSGGPFQYMRRQRPKPSAATGAPTDPAATPATAPTTTTTTKTTSTTSTPASAKNDDFSSTLLEQMSSTTAWPHRPTDLWQTLNEPIFPQLL